MDINPIGGYVDRIAACGPVSRGSIPGPLWKLFPKIRFLFFKLKAKFLSIWRRQEKVQISNRKMQISN